MLKREIKMSDGEGKIGPKLEVSYLNDSQDKLYSTPECLVAQCEIRYAEISQCKISFVSNG